MEGPSNPRFAEAVTTQAFALTLSRSMIDSLVALVNAADNGRLLSTNEPGIRGLERRGLAYWTLRNQGDRDILGSALGARGGWAPTLAGRLVLQLCRCAGLQPGEEPDAALEAVRARHAAQAIHEAEIAAEQDRKHQALMASIRPKLRPEFEGAPR